jgi:RimJ/RimL family protein N-acetyltransferase
MMAYPDDLSPKVLEIVQLYEQMRHFRVHPRSCYHDLPNSNRLRFELLNWRNYRTMLDLFGNDTSPFVMNVLRERDVLDKYTAYQLSMGHFSGKHGACDWFIKLEDGTCIGVLHLYEVSFELREGKRSPCFCGYAIAEPFRRKGYAEEALRHLLSQLPVQFQLFEAYAEPLHDNEASVGLLQKVGFTFKKHFENEWGNATLMYKQLVDEIPPLDWQAFDE